MEGGPYDDAGTARIERFRVLYDATYPRIMAYCLRRARDREDGLDAVSETFATVWRRLDDIPAGDAQIPWVYGVARRMLANQYRSRQRKGRLEHRLKDNRSSGEGGQSFDAVHEALDNLRPDDREILTMAAWDDLDNAEIAVALGITVGAVGVKLHRARKRLARELDRLGIGNVTHQDGNRVKSEGESRTPNRVNGTQPETREEPAP